MERSPAAGSVFSGRGDVSELFKKRLSAFLNGYRQNIGIIGPERIGKTTLVQHLIDQTSLDGVIIVFYSCQAHDRLERFSDQWMSEILLSVYRKEFSSEPEQFRTLLSRLKPVLPKTLQRMREIKKAVLKHKYDQAYRLLLTLSGLVNEETGKKIIFCIDEFQRLGEMGVGDPFGALGHEIMIQKETMFLVTSSTVAQSRTIFQKQLSLLFGNFEIVQLDGFDFTDAEKFIRLSFSQCELTADVIRFLVRLTGGNPFYITMLSEQFRASDELQIATPPPVAEILADALFEPSGHLYQYFQRSALKLGNGKPWQFYTDVLAAIASGHKRFGEIAKFLHEKSTDIKRALERLVELELISKHGSLFFIADSMFRFWLTHVYASLRFSFETNPAYQRKRFCASVGRLLEVGASEDKKELPKRIEELFKRFENDMVEFGERKLRCPHFSEVVSKPSNGRVFPVYAKNGKASWLCQALAGKVTEDDIHTFVDDLKRLKTPVEKRFIFGLRGIDLNAKLLAQEAKIQYLDLKQLNMLMDLYDKPTLID